MFSGDTANRNDGNSASRRAHVPTGTCDEINTTDARLEPRELGADRVEDPLGVGVIVLVDRRVVTDPADVDVADVLASRSCQLPVAEDHPRILFPSSASPVQLGFRLAERREVTDLVEALAHDERGEMPVGCEPREHAREVEGLLGG